MRANAADDKEEKSLKEYVIEKMNDMFVDSLPMDSIKVPPLLVISLLIA